MEAKKKILLVITKSNWGGAQRYVYDLATNLDRNIFDVAVALGGEGQLKMKLEEVGIKTMVIDRLGRDIKITDELLVFQTLIRLFRRERPDVIHLNSSKIGGIGSLAGRFVGVPKIIFTAHGFAFKEERNALFLFAIKIATWFTLLFCHKTIVLSKKEQDLVSFWPITGKKIVMIANGIPQIVFKNKNDVREELGLKIAEKMTVIGTIAELHKNKGLTYAIEALADLKDFPFIYMIISDGEERKNLEELIKNKRCQDKVFLAGHLDNAVKLLPALDIFILPSIKEGLPYTILEAGSAGLPVIASRVGGIPEIIENLKSGLLVTPRRPNEIKNALIYLHSHPEEMKMFGKNLQEKVAKDFSLGRMVTETEKLYLN